MKLRGPSSEQDLTPLLACAIGFTLLIYAYFFILLPQSWTLNNDYGWLLEWRNHPPFWERYFALNRGEMASGRFHPFYDLYIVFLYHCLPLKPVVFRLCQFFLLAVASLTLADILKILKFEKTQILLAEFLFLANLTIKDWITLPAAFEPVALVCFLLSLSVFFRNKKILAALLFFCSFLSKESFFVLLPTYFFLEYFFSEPKTSRNFWRSALNCLLFAIPTLVFVIFVARLPRVYTAGKMGATPLGRLFISFVVPPVKAFGPALVLGVLGIGQLKKHKLLEGEKTALVTGVCIIVFQTLILATWGPFDSWFYLHMAIPVGWAMVIGSLWSQTRLKDYPCFSGGLVGFLVVYLLLVALHGSDHLWNHLDNAKTVAAMACEDYEKDPTLKIYSNCNEGSAELYDYLVAFNVCKNPPTIQFTGASNRAGPSTNEHTELLFSPLCDGPTLAETPQSEIKLRYWTVFKY